MGPFVALCVLPVCYIPVFGFYAIYGFARGVQIKSTRIKWMSAALGLASGGTWLVYLGLAILGSVIGTTFKVFGLDDELRLFFEQLASTLATIAATETPAPFP